MGMIAGSITTSNKIGMVGGYPTGEINRLFHAFAADAKSGYKLAKVLADTARFANLLILKS